jgi:hypothetical protein
MSGLTTPFPSRTGGLLRQGLFLLVALPAVSSTCAHENDSWDGFRGERRAVVVRAISPEDRRLAKQRGTWQDHRADLVARDVAVVEWIGADNILTWPERRALSVLPSLRSLEANLADQPWAIILIGRDGGVKARWDQPVPMSDLTRLIDAMPMGRREKAARDAAGADHL